MGKFKIGTLRSAYSHLLLTYFKKGKCPIGGKLDNPRPNCLGHRNKKSIENFAFTIGN